MAPVRDFWSAPFTKSGRSALVPRGPWAYAMTGIGVHYRADPSALSDAVPRPLEVVGGEVFAYVVEITSWSPSAPELNVEAPEHVQYSEGAFLVKVRHGGREYLYCPFMWVDSDLPLLRGLLAGWPKKLARIALTRLHPLMPPLDGPRRGLRLGGYVGRAGSTLFRLRVELEEDSERSYVPLLSEHPFLLPRYFAGVAPGLAEVNELVELEAETAARSWGGAGEIEVVGSVNDELHFFEPASEVRGYYFLLSLKVRSLRVVGRIEGF